MNIERDKYKTPKRTTPTSESKTTFTQKLPKEKEQSLSGNEKTILDKIIDLDSDYLSSEINKNFQQNNLEINLKVNADKVNVLELKFTQGKKGLNLMLTFGDTIEGKKAKESFEKKISEVNNIKDMSDIISKYYHMGVNKEHFSIFMNKLKINSKGIEKKEDGVSLDDQLNNHIRIDTRDNQLNNVNHKGDWGIVFCNELAHEYAANRFILSRKNNDYRLVITRNKDDIDTKNTEIEINLGEMSGKYSEEEIIKEAFDISEMASCGCEKLFIKNRFSVDNFKKILDSYPDIKVTKIANLESEHLNLSGLGFDGLNFNNCNIDNIYINTDETVGIRFKNSKIEKGNIKLNSSESTISIEDKSIVKEDVLFSGKFKGVEFDRTTNYKHPYFANLNINVEEHFEGNNLDIVDGFVRKIKNLSKDKAQILGIYINNDKIKLSNYIREYFEQDVSDLEISTTKIKNLFKVEFKKGDKILTLQPILKNGKWGKGFIDKVEDIINNNNEERKVELLSDLVSNSYHFGEIELFYGTKFKINGSNNIEEKQYFDFHDDIFNELEGDNSTYVTVRDLDLDGDFNLRLDNKRTNNVLSKLYNENDVSLSRRGDKYYLTVDNKEIFGKRSIEFNLGNVSNDRTVGDIFIQAKELSDLVYDERVYNEFSYRRGRSGTILEKVLETDPRIQMSKIEGLNRRVLSLRGVDSDNLVIKGSRIKKINFNGRVKNLVLDNTIIKKGKIEIDGAMHVKGKSRLGSIFSIFSLSIRGKISQLSFEKKTKAFFLNLKKLSLPRESLFIDGKISKYRFPGLKVPSMGVFSRKPKFNEDLRPDDPLESYFEKELKKGHNDGIIDDPLHEAMDSIFKEVKRNRN